VVAVRVDHCGGHAWTEMCCAVY